MNNKIELHNKTVLVTGGNQGIGAMICRAMAACGAHIVINYFEQEEQAKQLAEELKSQYKSEIVIFGADISDQDQVDALFSFIGENFGQLDVLVNNAGCETTADALYLNMDEWDKIFNVNLRGAFMCAQKAGRLMATKNAGVIINMSSIHDKVPRKGLVHYCAAKAGMNMMTKCLALELAEHGVRVVTISPGAIETEMNREEIARFGKERFNNWIPAGRIGSTEDVANMCAFMASDMASYITATEIYIDGGYKESTIPYDPRKKNN